MKLRRSIVCAAFAIALAAGVQGQVPFGGTRIALIDTGAFYDPVKGIKKLSKAYADLNKEFKAEHDALEAQGVKYRALAAEIQQIQGQLNGIGGRAPDRRTLQATLTAKSAEAGRLASDLKRKQDDAKARYDKRESVLADPIRKDIGEAIEAFRKKNNYDLIFDTAKLLQSTLSANPALDVTAIFIKEYNAKP